MQPINQPAPGGDDLNVKPWPPIDDALALRVKDMVVETLVGSPGSLDMALEITRQALQWADQLIEGFESVNPLPRPIVCQAGCSFCCHNQVELTPPEVILLAQVIRQYFSPAKLERITEKILKIATFKAGKTREELAASRQERPCPLLEEDKCLIYPWRPLMCRSMHSLDQEHCRQSLAAGDLASDEHYLHRHTFTFSIAGGLTEGFGTLGCQTATLELTQALGDALLEPHLAERWLKGEQVFRKTSA